MADEEDIGIIVIEKARYIFEKLGCEDDFCIQYVGGSSVVFGGVNRLLWTPRFGFKDDRIAEAAGMEYDQRISEGMGSELRWALDRVVQTYCWKNCPEKLDKFYKADGPYDHIKGIIRAVYQERGKDD